MNGENILFPRVCPVTHFLHMSKKIYIIEDEEVVQKSIAEIINMSFDDCEIVGFNINGQIGVKECIKLKPDLAIVDIRLPDVNGLEILHILKKRNPKIKVLIFSGILDLNTMKHAYHGKADGILEKPGSVKEIKAAIKTVLSGDNYYSLHVMKKLLAHETVAPFGPQKS